MSRDADDEYFSDGLAEEIINALVKMPGLKVIARTSAFAFKGQEQDIRKIAEALGVTNVLEGSVRRAGNRIRVTAQLITAADGSHLWSERYDREMDDLFAVQDEIAAAIAGGAESEVRPRVRPHPRASRTCRHTRLISDTATINGVHAGGAPAQPRMSGAGALRSIRNSRCRMSARRPLFRELTLDTQTSSCRGRASLAERALELDPDLPGSACDAGVLAGFHKPDWKEAERRFRIAMAREPVPWHVRSWYPCSTSVPWAARRRPGGKRSVRSRTIP